MSDNSISETRLQVLVRALKIVSLTILMALVIVYGFRLVFFLFILP